MNHFVRKNLELRSDLSEWLVHFTKGTDVNASATLTQILREKALLSKSTPPAVCFTEAPLREFSKLFELFRKYPEPRLAPFGIAVKKDWLFEQGGRPAIYGPAAERELLPDQLKFRHVTYTPSCDFTWMREWRIGVDRLALEPEHTLVVVPTEDAAWGLTHESGAEQEYDGPGEYITEYWSWRDWHSLALDHAAKQAASSDVVMAKSLADQKLERREEDV